MLHLNNTRIFSVKKNILVLSLIVVIAIIGIAVLYNSTAVEIFQESRITFQSGGQKVVGTLSVPNGDPAPVVLLLHGFTGSRDTMKTDYVKKGVYPYSAKKLAEAGYASLRIDFRGSGESIADINFAQTTFEGQVQDGIAAIDYIKSINSVDGDDIYIIGWSQGGLVAAGVAGRTASADAVALWAAVADVKLTYGGLLGEEMLKTGMEAADDQPVTAKFPWGTEVTLNGSFFKEIQTFNPLDEIKNYPGPLFVAQGLKDKIVHPQNAEAFIAAHEGPEQLWTAEMNHSFNAYTTSKTLDTLLAETISFFDANND